MYLVIVERFHVKQPMYKQEAEAQLKREISNADKKDKIIKKTIKPKKAQLIPIKLKPPDSWAI